ncbi:MAG: YesU family protein [Colwellia sp.]|nr:YesU family protein [Colwellia sp.]
MKKNMLYIIVTLSLIQLSGTVPNAMSKTHIEAKILSPQTTFDALNKAYFWQQKFNDNGRYNWQEKWFLDGKEAHITHSENGMTFTTGEIEMDPSHHAVLWTKKNFVGDIKIEYDFTRLDTENKWATMLYVQATGVEDGIYHKDIGQWRELRNIPYMKTYFNHMNLLHISYASYGKDDIGVDKDYIRARRYPVKEGDVFRTDTVIEGDVFTSGFFVPNETYHIIVIKKQHELFMQVTNKNKKSRLFSWNTSKFPLVKEGRIGLRQMWRKSATYRNITVSTLK